MGNRLTAIVQNLCICFATFFMMLAPQQALAHASHNGHILLLPTRFYLVGGAVSVAASILLLTFISPQWLIHIFNKRLTLFMVKWDGRASVSLLSFLFLVALVLTGYFGTQNPLANPLPLTIWTLLWVALALLHGIFGNLWAWLNPWYGPWCVWNRVTRSDQPRYVLPAACGKIPAVLMLFGFAWLQLVSIAPDVPQRLALIVSIYWLFNFTGMCIFGFESWSGRVEFLTVFFRMLARLSPFASHSTGSKHNLTLGLPGNRLTSVEPLPISGVLFLLLALGAVSFDGLADTFIWLSLIGINPLEFPGRSAVKTANTIGLLIVPFVLGALFLGAIYLGDRIAGGNDWKKLAGMAIWSIVPVSLAYHLTHYLTSLLVDLQYAMVALMVPLSWTGFIQPPSIADVKHGVVMGADAAWMLWNIQAGAIIIGHIIGIVLAHIVVFRHYGDAQKAKIAELPLSVLIIGYTVFGLWLLSTPSIS